MSTDDVSTDETAADAAQPDDARTGEPAGTNGMLVVLAVLSGAAGVIHLAMTPSHASDSLVHGIGFAVAGWFQLGIAVALLVRPSHKVLLATVAGNLAILGVWAVSRTIGLPGGAHSWHPESVTFIDLATAGMEAALVIGAAVAIRRPVETTRFARALTPSAIIASLAVLALATSALASPSAQHDHHGDHGDGGHADGGGHDHGTGSAETADGHHAAAAQTIALEDRCDLEFNTAAYYREAQLAGLDPFALQPAAGHDDHGASTTDELDHEGHDAEQQAVHEWADAVETAGDEAVTATTPVQGEAEAARRVVELSLMSDEAYDAEIRAMADQHRSAHAPDDNGGHGGHDGPSPWIPMTDQAECDQLATELDQAQDIALSYPTPVEAVAAGYRMVTGYVPGIAAHYMHFGYVDGTFELDKPEMLLYDGTGDDAHMVGLSYYVVHEGDEEPAEGFTGPNDHYHRHVGLCISGGVVIGSSTTTAEECAAMGGRKSGGSGGWMNHVWVVPGCDSPWGMFSAANPRLDLQVGQQSGQGEPCSGGIRDYDATPGPDLTPPAPAADTAADGGGGGASGQGEEAAAD